MAEQEANLEQIQPQLSHLNTQLSIFRTEMKELEEKVSSMYLDLLVFDVTMFLLNANVLWNAPLNIPVCFLMLVQFLFTYLQFKSFLTGGTQIFQLLDSLLILGYLVHMSLYINNFADFLYESSILMLVVYLLILLVKVKQVFIDQPFFKFFLVTNFVHWITRLFLHLILVSITQAFDETVQPRSLDLAYRIANIYFYIMITFNIFSLYQPKFKIVKGKLLIISVFVGIVLNIWCVTNVEQAYNQNDRTRIGNNNIYYLSIYDSIQVVLLIKCYPIIMQNALIIFFSQFFKTCHQNYDSIQLVTQVNQIQFQVLPAIVYIPKIKPVKEYLTKGVSRVALERVTQTLFKVVENIDTSENQLETQQPVQPLDFLLINQNITIQEMIENKVVTLKTETDQESQLQLVKRGFQNDEVISLSESDRNDNCILCFEASPNAVFHPCGHGGQCYSCASKILSKQQLCPLCRSPIESILKYKVQQDATVQNKTNIQIISLSSCNRKITPKISLNL